MGSWLFLCFKSDPDVRPHECSLRAQEVATGLETQAPNKRLMTLMALSHSLSRAGRLAAALQHSLDLAKRVQHRSNALVRVGASRAQHSTTCRGACLSLTRTGLKRSHPPQASLEALVDSCLELTAAQQVAIYRVRTSPPLGRLHTLADAHHTNPSTLLCWLAGAQVSSNVYWRIAGGVNRPPAPANPHLRPLASMQAPLGDAPGGSHAPDAKPPPPAGAALVPRRASGATEAARRSLAGDASRNASRKSRASAGYAASEAASAATATATATATSATSARSEAQAPPPSAFDAVDSVALLPPAGPETRPVERGTVAYTAQSASVLLTSNLRRNFAYDPAHGDIRLPLHVSTPALVLPIMSLGGGGAHLAGGKAHLGAGGNLRRASAREGAGRVIGTGLALAGQGAASSGGCTVVIQMIGKVPWGTERRALSGAFMPGSSSWQQFHEGEFVCHLLALCTKRACRWEPTALLLWWCAAGACAVEGSLTGLLGTSLSHALSTWDAWQAAQKLAVRRTQLLRETKRLAYIQVCEPSHAGASTA